MMVEGVGFAGVYGVAEAVAELLGGQIAKGPSVRVAVVSRDVVSDEAWAVIGPLLT